MSSSLETWKAVAARPDLLAEASLCDATDVASVARLRRQYPAELVAVALSCTEARRKAVAKFPQRAERLWADPQGVEQASSMRVASYKASRWRRWGVNSVADLCCGVGGDAMGLTDAGLAVTGIDRDPLRAWMTTQNAGCDTLADDVLAARFDAEAIHLDPARRTAGRRVFRLADHEPGSDVIRSLLTRHPRAAIKLSPAVDYRELDDAFPDTMQRAQVEIISEHGRLVQAVLWQSPDILDSRAATLLIPGRPPQRLTGSPQDSHSLTISTEQTYLFTADSSVERAGLLHRLSLPLLHPRLGLLTADELRSDDPWLTPFKLLADMPYRPRRLKAWLRDHDGGVVEIKTRGNIIDTDRVQSDLRGEGQTPFTIFIMRQDQRQHAWITQRIG